MKILIDPGHGGKEQGAVGPTGLLEKDVNLRVAYFLKTLLENDGFEVFLTRTKDVTLTLKERVEIARKLSPCLFLSIHHNANSERNTHVNRFEVFVPFEFEGPSVSLGRKLAEVFSKHRGQIPFGPMPARYTVLKSSPFSVLVEPGYIINPDEEKRLRSDSYLKEEAKLLYEGIKWVLEDGCNFRLTLKRHTPREIVISRKDINIASLEVTIDDTSWGHYTIEEEYIKVLYPASWKKLHIKGTTPKGIEIFPFRYTNPEYVPIVSFSQSVREFGNLKLVHLSFFDNRGEYAKRGLKVRIKAKNGEVIKSSDTVEERGSVYILLKTDIPENEIEVSFKGFQAITNVHSIEDLRNDEIAGIVHGGGLPLENTLIKHERGYTISGKLGVFKTEVDDNITFLKKGYYPFYLVSPEPKENYYVEMRPIFPGISRKRILLRASMKNTAHDGSVQMFSSIFKNVLLSGGALVKDIITEFPGWDNEPYIVHKTVSEKPDLAIKVQSKENRLILYHYYRDTDTLEILKRISSYFYKLDIPSLEIKESSDYFAIHPSGRRIIINIPFNMNRYEAHLYSYLIFLGFEHYFADEPLTLEKLETEGSFVRAEHDLLTIPVKDGYIHIPTNILKLKLFTEEQTCIHLPDGNSAA